MHLLLPLGLLVLQGVAFSQTKLIRKSWIKTSIEELDPTRSEPDTNYLRYEFKQSILLYGFDPGWSSHQQPWSAFGKSIKIGFDTWRIEELTDSTLVIFLKGFRRMKFVAEDYVTRQEEYLEHIGSFNGKPLYKANRFITPRYTRSSNLRDDLRTEDLEDYNIHTARHFLMSFIVTETGSLEDIKVLKGVAQGYDRNMINSLKRTGSHWRPALFKGQPVQSLMFYEIIFLDSIVEH